jgi:importin subunit beta-1
MTDWSLGRQEQIARHTAALALAKVAAIELPLKQWQNLISTLLANMGQQPPNPTLKQATLESLGYICEEMAKIPQDVLEQEQVNSILTAVHQGMHKDEPDVNVRRAATTALYNALEFAQTNFENAGERDVLMMAICEGTTAPDEEVRKESFQCLVKVGAGYYEKLPSYMQTIFGLTQRAVKEDVEDVAKQAIEFWCTVAEEEIDLQEVRPSLLCCNAGRSPLCFLPIRCV